MNEEKGSSVKLFIYDLSKGLAKSLSSVFLGKHLDGVWHTGIVVYDREFFYGGEGIQSCPPRGTVLGTPDRIEELGDTQIPLDLFKGFLNEIGSSTFDGVKYSLFEHNCNTFSNEVAQFLVGKSIPSYITNLPQEILSTPFGSMLKPMIESMTVSPTSEALQSRSEICSGPINDVAGVVVNPTKVPSSTELFHERSLEHNFDPAVATNFEKLLLENKLKLIYFSTMKEIHEFMVAESTTWSLSPYHIQILCAEIDNAKENLDIQIMMDVLLELSSHQATVRLFALDQKKSFIPLVNRCYTMPLSVQLGIISILSNLCSEETLLSWVYNSVSLLTVTVDAILHENLEMVSGGMGLSCFVTKLGLQEEGAVKLGSALLMGLERPLDVVANEKGLASLKCCLSVSSQMVSLAKIMNPPDLEKLASFSTICQKIVKDLKLILSQDQDIVNGKQ